MTVVALAAQLASTPSGLPNVTESIGESESKAARFADLLSAGNVMSTPAPSVQPVTQVQPPTNATLGDVILSKLSAIGTNYQRNVAETAAVISRPSETLGLRDLLKIQISMAQVTLDVELISKGVSKFAQHIDTLTKLQ